MIVKSQSEVDDSEESDDDYDYCDLTDAQRKRYKSYFKYIGKNFVDKDESGEIFKGIVTKLVMYKKKNICFDNSTQYIYVECLIGSPDIKWQQQEQSKRSSIIDSCTASNAKQTQRPKWRGWVEVNPDDEKRVSLADEFESLVEVGSSADGGRILRNRVLTSKRV